MILGSSSACSHRVYVLVCGGDLFSRLVGAEKQKIVTEMSFNVFIQRSLLASETCRWKHKLTSHSSCGFHMVSLQLLQTWRVFWCVGRGTRQLLQQLHVGSKNIERRTVIPSFWCLGAMKGLFVIFYRNAPWWCASVSHCVIVPLNSVVHAGILVNELHHLVLNFPDGIERSVCSLFLTEEIMQPAFFCPVWQ